MLRPLGQHGGETGAARTGPSRHRGEHTKGLETGMNLGSQANLGKEEQAGMRIETTDKPPRQANSCASGHFKPISWHQL